MRTGDAAIIAGTAAIVAYEILVADDEDLISRRVAAYRRRRAGRLLTDAAVLVTALHLCEYVPQRFDVFHHAMRLLR